MSKMFEERNPRPIAVISLTVIALLLLLGVRANSLPFVSPANTYQAYFANSSGLAPGDNVRIAGVPVGQVLDVRLKDAKVLVTFEVDTDQHVGDRTTAGIELQTFLGTKFVSLAPQGDDELGAPIPVERTTVPYDLPDALSDLGETATAIDTGRLDESLTLLTETLAKSEPDIAPLLDNLARVSEVVASRDDELDSLLEHTKTVSATLAERDQQVLELMGDAQLFFDAISTRRQTIAALLVDVRNAAQQIRGLLDENAGQLDPLLDSLHTTTELLEANLPALDSALTQLAPASRYLANATGNGRWLDLYIENLGEVVGSGLALPAGRP